MTAPSPAEHTERTGHAELADLGPLAQLRAGSLARRVPQLLVGLVMYGASLALMVRGGLGLSPWDVLHSGMIEHIPLTLGQCVVLMSFVVLLAWIPLREKPGIGTIANALLVGTSADVTLGLVHHPSPMWEEIAFTVGGIVLNAFATALYIGAQFGRGPRDGLMTGLNRRTGRSIRLVRTGIELTVLLIGIALGGSFGVGTIAYALLIGPLAQRMLPSCTVRLHSPSPRPRRGTAAEECSG